jgi:hypothetical protein
MGRVKNEKVLNTYRARSCDLCGAPPRNTASHIIPKSQNGPDLDWNLKTLCSVCHFFWETETIEQSLERFPGLEELLNSKGFYYDEQVGLTHKHRWEEKIPRRF